MNVPESVAKAMSMISSGGYEAYLVGGCVRDSIAGIAPNDYDICTNATPAEIESVFSGFTIDRDGEKSGTVSPTIDGSKIDISTFRKEGSYSDGRRPDSVSFVGSIEDDLSRRDFTVNAMAESIDGRIIDPFGGQDDLKKKVIRCVGDPNARFKENPLRMLRAFRFSAKLNALIDPLTLKGIRKNAYLIKKISKERITSELKGILLYDPGLIEAMHDNCILRYILPKIDEEFRVQQNNQWHYTDVGHHTVDALRHSMIYQPTLGKDDLLLVRASLLFHDVGKITAKTTDSAGHDHFYGHPEVSYAMTSEILKSMKWGDGSETILKLVRYHDFPIYPKRKLLLKIIDEYKLSFHEFELLGYVRECDIFAHSNKGKDDRMDRYGKMLEMYRQKMSTDRILSERDLAIDGDDIMRIIHLQPGKLVGEIKRDLYQLVFLNPSMNDRETLEEYLRDVYERSQ